MFHLELKLLRSFVAVAAEGSVTRAAARLNISQPTVSGQIKQLEEELGFCLFNRSTRHVALSSKGALILPQAKLIIDECRKLKRAVEEMQVAKDAHFTLGAAMFSMDFADRLDLLDAFNSRHPDVRYVVSNQFQCMQVQDLIHGRLDVALLLGIAAPMRLDDRDPRSEAAHITNECVYPDSLERVILSRRSVGALLPAESPLAAHAVIPRTAIAGHQVTTLSQEHGAAFLEPIAAFFRQNNCTLISPPEGNALAIERYAVRNRAIAIGINWFPVPAGMVWREVEGLDSYLDYSLVIGPSANRAARRFFVFAGDWAKRRPDDRSMVDRAA